MVAEKFISQFFTEIQMWRRVDVTMLESFQRTMNYNGVEEIDPILFPRAADSRWRVRACDRVLEVRGDITSLPELKVLSEGLRYELACAGRAGGATEAPPSYWEMLGYIEQEASRLVHFIEVRE